MDRPGYWSDRGSAEILLDPIHNKFRYNFSRVAARDGLVLPVVMTQCALRSKNTAYLPRADRGTVNCIHEKFCPGSPVRNRGPDPVDSNFRSESI